MLASTHIGIFSDSWLLWFGCSRQQKCHAAAPPPAGVRRRMERNRQKLVGRDKGSLTEQQTKGTGATTIQIRRKHNTNHTTQRADVLNRRHTLLSRKWVSDGQLPPPPEPSMTAHGMEYPALFGQVGSARPTVPLPGFSWKLTLSWLNPGHRSIRSSWSSQSNLSRLTKALHTAPYRKRYFKRTNIHHKLWIAR